jgi:hypothetical protein
MTAVHELGGTAVFFFDLTWPRSVKIAPGSAPNLPQSGHDPEAANLCSQAGFIHLVGFFVVETVAAYAHRVEEAVAPYLGDAAVVSVFLLLLAFWMLVVLVLLQDE